MKKLLLLPIITILISCSKCEDYTEPKLTIIFDNYDHFDDLSYYRYYYGLGGKDTMDMDDKLPLSIISDTSTYILFNAQRTDTLSISYHRTFKYSGENCGFSIFLDSFKLLDGSTFDSVEFQIIDSTNTYFSISKRNEYKIIIYH